MKKLHYPIPNNLSALHDELLVALPTLAPVKDAHGTGTPVIQVSGNDKNVWLTVPDDADDAAITAVVNAHDATKTQPDPSADRRYRLTELLKTSRSNWTTAQLREIMELTTREVTG